MGFSASWVAVQGAPRDAVLVAVGLQPTGRQEQYPESRFCLAELPGDWRLIWYDDDLEAAFAASADLSRLGPAVACAIEEHVMVSQARGYADGVEVWRVRHDAERDEGLYHLDATGDLPAAFARIHADLKAEQDADGGKDAEVDYIFDVPPQLARSICGFKHGEDPPEGVVFEVLKRGAPRPGAAKPGFFARLFGGR